jgi:hypothetical protein
MVGVDERNFLNPKSTMEAMVENQKRKLQLLRLLNRRKHLMKLATNFGYQLVPIW